MNIDRSFAAAALSAVLALGTAHAQYTNQARPGSSFRTFDAARGDITLTNMMRQSQMISYANSVKAAGRGSARSVPQAPAAAPAAPRQPLSASDFRPSAKRTAADEIAAAVADPAARAQMRETCRRIQATLEATPGFRRNNLANALALVVGASLQVLMNTELGDAQAKELTAMINDEIVSSGAFRQLSAEKRTRLYDAMLITGGLIAGLAHNAAESGDREQADQARTMARDALQSLGLRM